MATVHHIGTLVPAVLTATYCVCTYLQDVAVFEVVSARSALERTEGDTSSGQRRNIAEIVATDRLRLVVAMYQRPNRKTVGFLTRRRVELPRLPLRPLCRSPVNGEAFRPTGVKLESDVRYLERLTCARAHAVSSKFQDIGGGDS